MSVKQRIYFVIDMKTFFASVECAERGLDPFKTNLVVADSTRGEGTVCLAITPKMKELGIKNRCRLFEIPKNVKFIMASPRMKKYIEYASKIYGIYLKYISSSDIHVYSIDECFIDATDYLKIYKMSAKEFALKLMNEIKETLSIPSTCGIGTNLYLAKIALDITAKNSKDRIGFLDEETFKQTLWEHKPLTDFWGISYGISSKLEKYCIYDMKGIATADEDFLYELFGVNAELLIDHAKGIETCLMEDIKKYKSKSRSLSSSQILPSNYNFSDAKIVMQEMVQNGCYDLMKQNVVTQHLRLIIGYGDNKKTREKVKNTTRMKETTNLYTIISKYFNQLFDEIVDKTRPIRQIAYGFDNLLSADNEYYDFFTDLKKIKKEKDLTKKVIEIQEKYGKNSVLKGLDLQEKATQKDRNNMIGGHKSGEN